MSDWQEIKLGECVESVSKTFKFSDEKVVFLNTSDILDGKILNKNLADPKSLPGQAKKSIQKGDLLFSEIRPINKRFAIVNFNAENYVVSTKLMVLRPTKLISNDYLKFYLTSPAILNYLQMIAEARSGSFPQITFDNIKELELSVPSLKEQEAITDILNSLNDKIDLLNRNNETLEELIKTVFRNLLTLSSKEVTEKKYLGELVKVIDNRGKTPKFSELSTGYPVIEVNALNGLNRFIDYRKINKYVDEYTFNNSFRSGHPQIYDILISTVGSIGELSMMLSPLGCIAQNIVALRSDSISPFYLYQYLLSIQDEIKEFDIGSVQPSLKVTHLTKIEVPIIEDSLIEYFDVQAKSICEKILSNYHQVRNLENLRDILLPKLMGGSLKVNL